MGNFGLRIADCETPELELKNRIFMFVFSSISKFEMRLVAVGTALTGGPSHRSVREGLPHTALTSGSCDGQPLVGIWMQYPRGREPVANQPCHVLLTSATKFLTAPSQNAKPDAAHLVAEPAQTRAVSRYRMIVEPPPNHRPQPRAHFGHRAVHVPFELRFDLQ